MKIIGSEIMQWKVCIKNWPGILLAESISNPGQKGAFRDSER